ncbi:uncharacterized protein LOC108092428 [Drosophila ficusphila]|uniref:uncharacterized protein LOC108092428 n=1 Tax=Drosophila ficusphila TaxID=30025 RepID=UPI0007E71882|nr:uncharacterized protein LOC108092428 [Drosophila ficusphila]
MMNSILDTPIASIYDMMMERYLKRRRESEQKETKAEKAIPRRMKEDRIVAEVKKPLATSKTSHMKWTSLDTSEVQFPDSANAVTAAHLTKKQTFLKILPPTEKAVINRLVEKISKGRTMIKPVTPKAAAGIPRTELSGRRKRFTARGSLKDKHKLSKSSTAQLKRQPLSPKKADPGEKDAATPSKAPAKKEPKALPENSRSPMRFQKLSEASKKSSGIITNRWRL